MKNKLFGRKPRGLALLTAVILLVSGVSFAGASGESTDSGAEPALTDLRLLDAAGNDLDGAATEAGAAVTLEYSYRGNHRETVDSDGKALSPDGDEIRVECPPEIDLAGAAFFGAEGEVTGGNTVLVRPLAADGTFSIGAALNAAVIGAENEKTLLFPLSGGDTKAVTLRFAAARSFFSTEEPFNFLTSATLLNSQGQALGKNVPKDAKVRVAYQYKYEGAENIPTDVVYYFQMPEQIAVTLPPLPIKIEDDAGITVAEGEADGNGRVTIQFNKKNGAKKEGTMWFEANFDAAKIQNSGRQHLLFLTPDNTPIGNVDVDFAFDQIGAEVNLTKAGKADLTDKTIQWTITAKPQMTNALDGDREFSSWTITDEITDPNLTLTDTASCSITPNPGGSFSIDASGSHPKLVYTFPADTAIAADTAYTLKFKTGFKMDAFQNGAEKAKFKNKAAAAFQYPQYEKNPDTGIVQQNSIPKDGNGESKEASVEIAGGKLDKKGALTAGKEITWTVKVTNSLQLPDPKIMDTLPAGLSYKSGSAKIGGTSITPTAGTDAGGNKTLTFVLPDAATEQIITYVTTIQDGYWGGAQNFKNHVAFSGTGPGPSMTKDAEVELGAALVTKSGSYNPENHTIHWTIDLKKEAELTNVIITDVLPHTGDDALTYVENSLSASGAAGSGYDPATKTIAVEYSDVPPAGRTITFDTLVDNAHYWAVNLTPNREMENKITIKADGLQPVEVTGKATVTSEVLKKEKDGVYDVIKRHAGWKLTVNRNKMEMTNAVIKDTIPDGWEFADGSFQDINGIVSKKEYNASTRLLTLTLKKMERGGGPYEIRYQTRLVDESKLENNGQPEVSNTAIIQANEIPGEVTSTAKQQIAKSVVTKVGEVKVVNAIQWTVLVNNNLLELENPKLEDNLAQGLTLDPFSVKLYRLELDRDGSVKTRTEESVTPANIQVEGQVFTFQFNKTIQDAYELVFSTDVDAEKEFTNEIHFQGGTVDLSAKSAPVKSKVSSSGGGTAGSQGSVKITKTDTEGNPLKGVAFQMGIATAVTDENGVAHFEKVKAGTYDITELKPLEGYVCDPKEAAKLKAVAVAAQTQTPLLIQNRPIKCDVVITKTGEGNVPLRDVEIDLFRKDTDAPYGRDQAWTTGKTDADGRAAFTGLPYGDYYYREAAAPAGYLWDSTLHPFTVVDEEPKSLTLMNRKPSSAPSGDGSSGGGGSSGGSDGGSSGGSGGSSSNGQLNPPPSPVIPDNALLTDQPGTETIAETTPQDTARKGGFDAPPDSHFMLTRPPEFGIVAVNGDGTWEYTPAPGFRGTDRFSVEIREPSGKIRPVNVLVTIEDPLVPKGPPNTGGRM